MKRTKRSCGIMCALAAIALSLSACDISPDEQGAGTVAITIGGGSARTAGPAWLDGLDLEDLVHTIRVLDRNGAELEQHRVNDLRYGQTSSFTLTPGSYTFDVTASHNGELKAVGQAKRTIHSGKNPAITIPMRPPGGSPVKILVSITVVEYTPTTAIFPDTTLVTLKEGLTVIAAYDDGSEKELEPDDYELSGDLTEGESLITVTYTEGGVTATAEFTVTVGPAHEHNWSKISETAPTCSATGMEVWECTNVTPSHHKDITIPIDPNAHTWGSWSLTQSNKGISTRICSNNTHTQASNEMVFVPGGTFQLGKDLGEAAVADVTPMSNVTLSDFYIGKFEVTQAQWIALMGSLGIVAGPMNAEGDANPVFNINWYRTLVFCNRLSISEGLIPAYRINNSTNPNDWGATPTSSNATWNNVTIAVSNGYRLLTEAQWEYAAKGGNPDAPGWVGYTYAGGDNPDDVAWLVSDPVTAREVGTKAPNFLGIYDMTGSVAEWCWDWHGDYTGEDKTDPTGASSGTNREHRGGSWYWTESNARSTGRLSYAPYNSYVTLGFRVARPAGEMEGLGDITAPVWNEGNAVSLAVPAVYVASGNTVAAQGWQISDDGTSGWSNFTAATAAMSHNSKYLRYYAAISGTTYYSNTVTIKVIPTGAREVTIDMFDNTNAGGVVGNGWDGNAALRIVVNGTELAAVKVETNAANNTPSGQRAFNAYTFFVYPDDVVQLYWVAGSLDQGNAFIAYYTDLPPVPAFTSGNTNSTQANIWNGSNALAFRLWGNNTARPVLHLVPDGTLLDEFTVSPISVITAPVWNEGNAPSLTAPTVFAFGQTINAQGWQISDNGTSGWTNFTATTATMSHNGRYLRYYATLGSTTYYSTNTVTIKVFSAMAREVTINMYDSGNDGWDGAGALRIVVNGTDFAAGVKAVGAASTYTFLADPGDVVQLYWVAGTYQGENSFIAYYTDTPPNPAFSQYSWDGENALVFRLQGTMNSIAGGELLGSFTVP